MAKTTLQSAEGYYVCAEGGGGMYAVADRPAAGPWETWEVETWDDGRVSLKASNGMYLCAEVDGRTVNVNRTSSGEWERFTIEVRDDAIVAFKSFHGTYLQAPLGGGANSRLVQVSGDPTLPGEWEFFTSSEKFWMPPHPICERPIVGPLRIQDKCFRDNLGYRRILLCSWFPALRILRDDRTEFYRQLDAITAAGYQGFRTFLAVGGWTDYWDGREVAPVGFTKWVFTGNHLRTDQYGDYIAAWPDYDDLLREMLRACLARKLKLFVTTGDMQIICPNSNNEIDLHRRFARICGEEGGSEVVCIVEVTNEFPLNRAGGDGPDSIEQMGRVLDVWREANPDIGVLMQGAIPQNEEPESLDKASTHGNACAVHVTRSPEELCLKRSQSLIYWEGDWRHYPKPFVQGEPAGPGEDSYDRQDDPAFLTALYAMHQITGQASVRFQGAAVRAYQALESEWGFTELPTICQHIPEDIVTWDHGHKQGSIEYWWKGNQFISVVYATWDPTPPRPVSGWTLYTGTSVHTGTGNPHKGSKQFKGVAGMTGLLVGTFT